MKFEKPIDVLHHKLQESIYQYLYYHSDVELVECDAQEEAGILAEEIISKIKTMEKNESR